MGEVFKSHKNLFISVIIMLIAGSLNSTVAILFSAVVLFYFMIKNRLSDLLVFFIFILILSDNYSYTSIATFIKPIFLLIILAYLSFKKVPLKFPFFKGFIPFFIVAFFCLLSSYSFFTSFQKTISYAILLIIVPVIVAKINQNQQNTKDFIRLLVTFCIFILALGLLLYFMGFSIVRVVEGDRIGGLFGNPNGLGIFSFLSTVLITVCYHLYPELFPIQWKRISYVVIIFALFMTASRGGILATVVFVGVFSLWVKQKPAYFFGYLILLLVILLSPQELNDQFNHYLRMDEENITSGRDESWEMAKEEINNGNYWLSKGMGYAEYYLSSVTDETSQHQGNVHNSYFTIWLDTGLIGLIFFIGGWLLCFLRTNKLKLALAILVGVVISTNVESWLTGSLNPFTILLLIILCLLPRRRSFGSFIQRY
jgi:hypothetical protein